MAWEAGNQLWMLATRPFGVPRKYEGPIQLLEAIIAYFEWAVDNPVKQTVVGWYKGEATEHVIEHERVYTVKGLSVHLGISSTVWSTWKKTRPDLADVQDWADGIMWEQKFTGAVAGVFNAFIIGRDLGLVDKSEFAGANGAPLQPTQIIFAPAGSELPVQGLLLEDEPVASIES